VPAGLAIALLGTALSLLNFGIDEFVNPRLRDSGGHSIGTRHGRVRMRVGFTPVIRDEDLRSARRRRRAPRRSPSTLRRRPGMTAPVKTRPVLEIKHLDVDYGYGKGSVRAVRDVEPHAARRRGPRLAGSRAAASPPSRTG